jgi:CBS domain-containing protein
MYVRITFPVFANIGEKGLVGQRVRQAVRIREAIMKLVKHILDSKGHDVLSIAPAASVLDAIKLMAEKGIGALIVLDGEALAGIVTERDYARKVILKGRSSHETPVKDIMSADVLTTSADQTVDSCMNMMTDRRIRHLPVVDGDKVTGMVSIGDLVKAIIADQKEAIEQLEHYITG